MWYPTGETLVNFSCVFRIWSTLPIQTPTLVESSLIVICGSNSMCFLMASEDLGTTDVIGAPGRGLSSTDSLPILERWTDLLIPAWDRAPFVLYNCTKSRCISHADLLRRVRILTKHLCSNFELLFDDAIID